MVTLDGKRERGARIEIEGPGRARARPAHSGGSIKQVAVEAAVLDGYEQVGRGGGVGAGQVGDGARDLEDAVVGARGEVQLFHGLLQEPAEGGVGSAVRADLRMRHAGVDGGARAGEAGALAEAGGLDARADDRR